MPGQYSCISTSNTFSLLVLSQWLLAFLPAHSPAPLMGLNLSVWRWCWAPVLSCLTFAVSECQRVLGLLSASAPAP